MKYFWWIAIAMVTGGVLSAVVGMIFRLDPLVVLVGIMLAMSGGVKMVMLRTWREMPAPEKSSWSLLRRR